MSSPMSSTSVPSQNYCQKHFEELIDHLSMHKNYALHQIHGSAAHGSLMTEQLPFYHQAPPVQHTQQLNQWSGDPLIWLQPEQQWPAAQPQQIERQRVGEEVLVVELERPLYGLGKPRLHWTQELHARFVRAVSEIGGIDSAKPKGILKKMNVKGLTLEQIKSHLQKVRKSEEKKKIMHQGVHYSANSHYPQLSGQGSSTSRPSAPLNGKRLESFQADIEAYGKLVQSSETPMYYQNFMFAPVGDYQDSANGSSFGL